VIDSREVLGLDSVIADKLSISAREADAYPVAVPDITSGPVLVPCKRRRLHQEFLTFLRHIDPNISGNLDVHPSVDRYATHKHARVKARWPRYTLRYTPTYSSWRGRLER